VGAAFDAPWAGQAFAPPTSLDIGTIETAIVNQLRGHIETIEIAHYPDKPETYRMTHRIGAALVRYDGAEYGRLIDTFAVVQERRLKFEITLMMRDLGWSFGGGADGSSPGAYATLESVRGTLTGFRVPGCGKMYPLREKFVERDKQGGVWIYAIIFALTTAAVEPPTTDGFPLFVKGVAQEQGGVTTTSLAASPYLFDANGQIPLANGNLLAVTVANATTGAMYAADADYEIDTVNGIIKRTANGAIAAGATVRIAYSYAEIVTAVAEGGSAPTSPSN
jgi:hypothetical protein